MMSKYIALSKNDFYSFITIIPLFILYQLLGLANNYKSPLIVKNSADVYIKDFFLSFSIEYANILYLLFFISVMLIIFLKNKQLFLSSELKLSYLFGIVLESLIHSISLLTMMALFSRIIPLSIFSISNVLVENIYLSIGAGLWEELLFRYIAISGMLFILSKITYSSSIFSYILIIIISSTLFSYYHFLGPAGDIFDLSIFIYRFIAGILLSIIFIFRGLGIAVYTHTFYDLHLAVFSG